MAAIELKMLLQIVSLCILLCSVVNCNQNARANIRQGVLQGSILESTNGRQFYAFRGVPYGRPPVGEMRFKQPQPANVWSGILDATKDGNACPQLSLVNGQVTGSEDCLFLNVYTPKAPAQHVWWPQLQRRNQNHTSNITGTLPVMVFIHGGMFSVGSSALNMYTPGRFLNKDVVLVTMNYRLGPIGFLNTEDHASVGNFGLYDQALALEWVKENIEAFFGDKSRVTIFGNSAGAQSVGFHLLSPVSAGLFKNAILQSGSPLNAQALVLNPLRPARYLADKVNCKQNETEEFVACLKTKTVAEILQAGEAIKANFSTPVLWAPSVERHVLKKKFLASGPFNRVRMGNINAQNVIMGLNKNEGSLWVATYPNITQKLANKSTWSAFVNSDLPEMLSFLKMQKNELETVAQNAARHYQFNSQTNAEELKIKLTDLITDARFTNGTDWFARELANRNVSVRLYIFDHNIQKSFAALLNPNVTVRVPSHGDELPYEFNMAVTKNSPLQLNDRNVSDHFIDLWTQFANSSNPNKANSTPTWRPFTSTNQSYLQISPTLQSVGGVFHLTGLDFWRGVQIPLPGPQTTSPLALKIENALINRHKTMLMFQNAN